MNEDYKLTPLEHLNVLQKIAKRNTEFFAEKIMIDISYKFIENALKALEIIKTCCVIADYKTDDPDTRYELAFCKKICITKEEYELLKEVLL